MSYPSRGFKSQAKHRILDLCYGNASTNISGPYNKKLASVEPANFIEFTKPLAKWIISNYPSHHNARSSISIPDEYYKYHLAILKFSETVKYWEELYHVPRAEADDLYRKSITVEGFNNKYHEAHKYKSHECFDIFRETPSEYHSRVPGVETFFPGELLFPWRFKGESTLKEWMLEPPSHHPAFPFDLFRETIREILNPEFLIIPTVADFLKHFSAQKIVTEEGNKEYKYHYLPKIIKPRKPWLGLLGSHMFAKESIVFKNPIEERDAIIMSPNLLLQVWYLNKVVDTLISGCPEWGNNLETYQTTGFLSAKYPAVSMVDLRKSGLTIPHNLIQIIVDEVIKTAPETEEVLKLFPVKGFPIILEDGTSIEPLRGLGLGMANALFTAMWIGLFRTFKKVLELKSISSSMNFLAFNDDCVLNYGEDNSFLHLQWEKFISDSGNIMHPHKSVYSLTGGVFCEHYNNHTWFYNFKWVKFFASAIEAFKTPTLTGIKFQLESLFHDQTCLSIHGKVTPIPTLKKLTSRVFRLLESQFGIERVTFPTEKSAFFGGCNPDPCCIRGPENLNLALTKIYDEDSVTNMEKCFFINFLQTSKDFSYLFRPWKNNSSIPKREIVSLQSDPTIYDTSEINHILSGTNVRRFDDAMPYSEKKKFWERVENDFWDVECPENQIFHLLKNVDNFSIPRSFVTEWMTVPDDFIFWNFCPRNKYTSKSHYMTYLYFLGLSKLKVLDLEDLDFRQIMKPYISEIPVDHDGKLVIEPSVLEKLSIFGNPKAICSQFTVMESVIPKSLIFGNKFESPISYITGLSGIKRGTFYNKELVPLLELGDLKDIPAALHSYFLTGLSIGLDRESILASPEYADYTRKVLVDNNLHECIQTMDRFQEENPEDVEALLRDLQMLLNDHSLVAPTLQAEDNDSHQNLLDLDDFMDELYQDVNPDADFVSTSDEEFDSGLTYSIDPG
eukprot:GHVT01097481.1.p1 GENE.GHVT01097481.1~~GHVT01097481.1.p1  ORF type:complete len:958 (-),score=-14.69 GHVT01097481.1:91-2964(-)